jgi:hypothetical protein
MKKLSKFMLLFTLIAFVLLGVLVSCPGPDEPGDDEEVTYKITFSVTPEGATVVVKDSDAEAIEAEEDGSYELVAGTYSYSVSNEGYVTEEDEFTVSKAATITVELAMAVVGTAEELNTKLADATVAIIKLSADITLERAIEVSRDVTILGNGKKLSLTVDSSTDYESYVAYVVNGKLTARDIELVSTNNNEQMDSNAVGITVQVGASLDLDSSKIVSNSKDRTAYGVYLQDGASGASIKNTIFDLTSKEGRTSIAIGLETSDKENADPFSILTMSDNDVPAAAYELAMGIPTGFGGNYEALMLAALTAGRKGLCWGGGVTEDGGQLIVENLID